MSEEMNWKDRIERAKKNGNFINDDIYKASNWSSCAISELDINSGNDLAFITKNKNYINDFNDLGMEFFFAVKSHNIARAEEMYNKIHSEYDSIVNGDVK